MMPATLSLAAAFPSSSGGVAVARYLRRSSSEGASPRRTSIRAVAAAAEAGPALMESRRQAASLYEVLRVERSASPTEIKSAYRSLAKLYHPDAAVRRPESGSGGGDGDFIEIRNAYETLSDPSARAMYDLSLMAAAHGGSRRRQLSSSLSMNRSSGFYPTRRWETDQCW